MQSRNDRPPPPTAHSTTGTPNHQDHAPLHHVWRNRFIAVFVVVVVSVAFVSGQSRVLSEEPRETHQQRASPRVPNNASAPPNGTAAAAGGQPLAGWTGRAPALTFGEAASRQLDWKLYGRLKERGDAEGLLPFTRQVFFLAFSFAILEPHAPVNASCTAPVLPTPPNESQCSPDVSRIFTGEVRAAPRRVGHAIQLGFDIDTLEILLRELDGVVDRLFIVEWTVPHNQRMSPKPLAWDAVKGQPRFAFARDMVVHFVMDDADAAYTDPDEMWSIEGLQERRRWEKIVEWNDLTKYFSEDDLVGLGDTDEIPKRDNVHLLKHCEWANDGPVDVGIWFPMGRIHQAFRTDFPVRGHPYTLGDPTYHVLGRARALRERKSPSRNRGKSPAFILGGAHFSNYGFFIYKLLKGMSCTECGPENMGRMLDKMHEAVRSGRWRELEHELSEMKPISRIVPIDQLGALERERVVYLPWFYNCNRDRYSMWEGKPDSRIA